MMFELRNCKYNDKYILYKKQFWGKLKLLLLFHYNGEVETRYEAKNCMIVTIY